MKRMNIVLFDEAEEILKEIKKQERLKNDEIVNKIIIDYNKLKKKEEKKK